MLNLPIHHIGIATKDIESEWLVFEKFGFVKEAHFIDKKQGVRGEFIVPKDKNFNSYRFELLENLEGSKVLDSYLAKNHKMYHIAYESVHIQKDLETLLNINFAGGGLNAIERLCLSCLLCRQVILQICVLLCCQIES